MFEKLMSFFKGKGLARAGATPQPGKTESADVEKETKPGEKRKPTPEELCGITAKMNKNEIRERLALLYRRYNRASSSLDAGLRAEAEEMLDAIVAVREKTFGPI